MFDKRLFRLAPGLGRLMACKVACMWVGLLANIGFMLSLVMLLRGMLTASDPHAFACDADSPADCSANLFDVPGVGIAPMAGDLMVYAALLIICALIRYATTTLAARFGTEAAERVKLALRSKLYRKMLAFGPSYKSRVTTADVVQSAGEGVEQIQSFFELFVPQFFYALAAPITLFAVIAPISMPSAVTMLIAAPLIIIVTGMVSMASARVFRKYWGNYTDMGAAFLDNLQGLETLKNFDADGRAAADMDKKAEGFRAMTMRVLQIQLRSLTAMDLVAYGGAAAGIGVALWQYAHSTGAYDPANVWSPIMWASNLDGWLAYPAYLMQYLMPFGAGFPLTLAGLLLIILLSAEFFIPMRQLGSYFHVAMNGMTSTKRIFALLDAPEPAHGTATLVPDGDSSAAGNIEVAFSKVHYAYDAQNDNADDAAPGAAAAPGASAASGAPALGATAPALSDISFAAYPGSLTAIVGVSGSGKSTAAALLAGSLVGYQGCITLNGVDAASLSGETLAQSVTLIGASSHLFSGTLKDNLLMARPGASDEELWQALERARVADFVRERSEGLAMAIEPDAANLSGGQRQRIAIARALLHDSPVFVFDEATSSVDVESEELILTAIRELAKTQGKTVLMITHRMANAEHADRIVVLDHGRSVETGTHGELMAADGRYAELFKTQHDIEHFSFDADSGQPMPTASPSTASPSTASPTTASSGDAPLGTGATPLSTTQVIARLLKEAKPLAPLMAAASIAGTIGHLAATFLPVFGVIAGFALTGNPVWGMGAAPAVISMAVCAIMRGIMRYIEQYLNHNVAFRLLALFRSKAFAALRRLAPAKLAGKGKGDLIAMLTTDVELLEIFFAHTISPVVIAVTTTIVYTIVLITLNPWMALMLISSHLIIGVLVPRFFATGVRNLGPAIRGQAGELDNAMLDDMRGLDEIIRFGRGEDRAQAIENRTRALWREHARLSRVNGRFAGVGGLLVFILTAASTVLAIMLAVSNPHEIPALVAAFVLFASSFGPTLALSALPANLTQTFAAAARLFAIMDERPAISEVGTDMPAYNGMRFDHVTFGYPSGGSAAAPSSGSAVLAGGAAFLPDDSIVPPNGSVDSSGRAVFLDAAAAPSGGSAAVPSDDSAVLADYSLDVPNHGVLGIQGPSGRGKSTLLKLLMRYWDPQSGQIDCSGTPLPGVDAHYRRRIQAMMSQETHLFDGTIRENLLIALPGAGDDGVDEGAAGGVPAGTSMSAGVAGAEVSVDKGVSVDKDVSVGTGVIGVAAEGASVPADSMSAGVADSGAVGGFHNRPDRSPALDDRLREALAQASVLDLVDSLPKGLDTQVGELGDRLSEGERQRIGLARVFLRDADLVLFDEPTSRLDALNEAIILRSIHALACDHGTAVVLVSHRESAMRIADQVVNV